MNKKYYAVIALVVMALVVISLFNRVSDNGNEAESDNYVTFDLVESDADTVADAGTEADVITESGAGNETDETVETDAGAEPDETTETGDDTRADAATGTDSETQMATAETGADDMAPAASDIEIPDDVTVADVQEPAAPAVTYVFRNSRLLNDHYEKHGIEMGFASAAEYEAAASAVITNPAALFKTEKEDGDYIYYLEATNEFVVLSTDGYIRTYFNPSSGKAYFDRQ